MDAILTRISCVFLTFSMCNGQVIVDSTIVFSPSELISDTITNSSEKLALRYGFHQTSECDDYEKTFLCIQKCLDKGYDVAYSDKYCFCTCYVKKQKAKYTPEHQFNRTRWKLGTPKTTKPTWIQKLAENAQETAIESEKVIKESEIQKEEKKTVIYDENNETETAYNHNTTISDITTNVSDSLNTSTKNDLIESEQTVGTSDTSVPNSTDSLNTSIATNATDSANEHENTHK